MSKIDELIEDITKEFKRCNTDYNGSATLDSDQINIIKQIEQLRPYVELAEIVIKNSKNLDRNSRFLKELGSYESDRLFELLQIIYNSSKEQSK